MTFTSTRRTLLTAAAAAAPVAALSACGGGSDSARNADGKIELTMAGWSIDSTPEFSVLKEGFEATNTDVVVVIKEYSADDYETQLTTDLSANSAPDLFPVKNLQPYHYLMSNGALADVSSLAESLAGDGNINLEHMTIDGSTYALPYRQDSWVIYYNKELFDAAGVSYPDGTWTWDDYQEAAQQLTDGLAGTDTPAKGTYHHIWKSVVQGFALAQSEGAQIDSGDLGFLAPYYDRALAIQEAGLTETFSTAQSQSLAYQAQFGTQKAAMTLMGSWYIATLLAQRESGDADVFEWGLAPAPQLDASTSENPVTFGDPTSLAINASLSGEKLEAAEAFLQYVVSEECSSALAEIGITPSYFSDAVVDTIFGLEGMPEDDVSRAAFQNNDTRPENPVGEFTNDIQTILEDTHSEILTGTTPVADALTAVEAQLENEGLIA